MGQGSTELGGDCRVHHLESHCKRAPTRQRGLLPHQDDKGKPLHRVRGCAPRSLWARLRCRAATVPRRDSAHPRREDCANRRANPRTEYGTSARWPLAQWCSHTASRRLGHHPVQRHSFPRPVGHHLRRRLHRQLEADQQPGAGSVQHRSSHRKQQEPVHHNRSLELKSKEYFSQAAVYHPGRRAA